MLSRAGWEARGPLEWYDHNGLQVLVDQTPPALLADQLEIGIQRAHETRLASSLGHPPGHRATLDLIRSRVGPKARGLSRQAKFLIRSCGCNGVWTNGRARLAGYFSDGLCLCGKVDTLHHRLYDC